MQVQQAQEKRNLAAKNEAPTSLPLLANCFAYAGMPEQLSKEQRGYFDKWVRAAAVLVCRSGGPHGLGRARQAASPSWSPGLRARACKRSCAGGGAAALGRRVR